MVAIISQETDAFQKIEIMLRMNLHLSRSAFERTPPFFAARFASLDLIQFIIYDVAETQIIEARK